ncbi:MAG: 16S rRNA (guanine(527)-N(7))-methyltransferase RsmG [Gammaproteobacteria bacterium]
MNPSELDARLIEIGAKLGLPLSAAARHQLIHYLQLLQQWNLVYNLTAIRDPQQMLIKHIADSLSIASKLQGTHCLDVGTGAGLPGVPLAIVNPEQQWTLLDSNSKKTRFLIQVKGLLKLHQVEVITMRVEDYQPKQLFDVITTRAWSQMQVMVEATRHLLQPTGHLYAMKGRYPNEELQNLQQSYQVWPITVPFLAEERHLVCIPGK